MPFAYVECLKYRWRRLAGATLVLVSLPTGCGPGNAGNEHPRHVLLYVSEEAGNPDVRYVDSPSQARTLLGTARHEYPAAVSPTGHIAVVSVRDSSDHHTEEIVLAGLKQKPRVIFSGKRFARSPSFSADGNYVFVETDLAGFRDIMRVDLRTLEAKRLTSSEHGAFEPTVDPAGRLVAFVASIDGNTEIFTMSVVGDDVRRLTAFHREDVAPRWSADGRRLAFISNREGSDRVFLMNADGTGQRRIGPASREIEAEADVAWFPVGEQIVFARRANGRWRLVLHDLASGDERYLTAESEDARFPAVSPDGLWIAFTSAVNGDTDVVVMRAAGDGRRTVDRGPAAQWLPVWGP